MLGKEVYFCDKKTWEVRKGVICSHTISTSGYEVYIIVDDAKQKESVEKALVFENEADAIVKAKESKPVSEKMIEIENEMIALLNNLRESVLGKPEHKELANELLKK